jgi:small-conductance mechanosensitive channel
LASGLHPPNHRRAQRLRGNPNRYWELSTPVIRFLAFLWWLELILQFCSLLGPVTQAFHSILSASMVIGSLTLSLGNIFAFAITIWAAFLISRFVRFLLEEDFYQRFNLARGANPEHVIELLKNVAIAHDKISPQPGPQAYFSDVASGALNFELRAWTEHYEEWVRIRSDLALAINDALVKENLATS